MKALRYFLKFQGSLAGEKSKFKGAAIARIKNWLRLWEATPAFIASVLEGGNPFLMPMLGG